MRGVNYISSIRWYWIKSQNILLPNYPRKEELQEMKKYYTFKRGTVVLIDFSPQVGSEIKGKHYAIVITKKDRNTNELLTVIPLTSKFHKYHIDFGDEIKICIYNELVRLLTFSLNHLDITIEDYKKIENKYASLQEHTYGKVHQITTISKLRIIKPINHHDPIRKLKVSNEILNKIDQAIIELFTNFTK